MKKPRAPATPPSAEETPRQRVLAALREGPATARDLSKAARVSERDVADHLAHLAKTLRAHGERLVIEPPECLDCGFRFPGRERTTRPSHCPRCRGGRVTLPSFRVSSG